MSERVTRRPCEADGVWEGGKHPDVGLEPRFFYREPGFTGN